MIRFRNFVKKTLNKFGLRVVEEDDLVFHNWHLYQNFVAGYSIVENQQGKWQVQLSLYFNPPEKKEKVLTILLNGDYENPFVGFQVLQLIGQLFVGLTPDVIFIDKNLNLIATLDLTKTLKNQKEAVFGTSLENIPKPTHEGSAELQ